VNEVIAAGPALRFQGERGPCCLTLPYASSVNSVLAA
jgi:hypothetical protein